MKWLEPELRKKPETEEMSTGVDDEGNQTSTTLAADGEYPSATTIATDEEHQTETR